MSTQAKNKMGEKHSARAIEYLATTRKKREDIKKGKQPTDSCSALIFFLHQNS
tara:strand:+ start:244 stop:402 length:159 start_codon:yes stop_codon:yes gene_type:complete